MRTLKFYSHRFYRFSRLVNQKSILFGWDLQSINQDLETCMTALKDALKDIYTFLYILHRIKPHLGFN
jgi:hypothetical protein